MTKGQNFERRRICRHIRCSSMSNSAWYDLKSGRTTLKLYDMCPKSKCKCRKQIRFNPRQFVWEVMGSNLI